MPVGFRNGSDAARKLDMGMLLYLLLSAGFVILMMRFGCGAHVIEHVNHDADGNWKDDGSNPSPVSASDFSQKQKDYTHG